MNWDDIRIFLAVARKGSLTAAGIDLSMSASSVSRHIDDLEFRLDAKLFLRSQTGYVDWRFLLMQNKQKAHFLT